MPRGRITVLLGPNGAGKTTAIRVITGALAPDAGTVRTFGLDPDADGEEVRRRCGVVSAKPALYDRLSGRDNLEYAAELYGLGRHADRRHRRRRRALRHRRGPRPAGGRLLDGHEDPAGPGPLGPARPRPAAVRRAHLRAGPRVLPRRARAHPGDDRRGPHRGDVHPPAGRGRGPGRPASSCSTTAPTCSPGPRRSSPAATGPPTWCASAPRTPPAWTGWPTWTGVVALPARTGVAEVQLDDLARVPDLVEPRWRPGRAPHPGGTPRAHARGPLLRRAATSAGLADGRPGTRTVLGSGEHRRALADGDARPDLRQLLGVQGLLGADGRSSAASSS